MLQSLSADPFTRVDCAGFIKVATPEDAANFVTGLEWRTLARRFHRFTTPGMVRAHYRKLNADKVMLFAWLGDGGVRGLSEMLLFEKAGCLQAELALCVAEGWRRQGVGRRLMARAAAEAASLGAVRSFIELNRGDCAEARIAELLGAEIDQSQEFAILHH